MRKIMIANDYDELNERISMLIRQLDDPDGYKRQHARHALLEIGWDAVPALIEVVTNSHSYARWEAIEALGRLPAPAAAPVLVDALQDEDVGVRWAASNALVALDRAAMKDVLTALTKSFDSIWLQQGAHHYLHVLKDRRRLLSSEIQVFDALESIAPEAQVPWAAQSALLDLTGSRSKEVQS
jgi:HEAT repeat protein